MHLVGHRPLQGQYTFVVIYFALLIKYIKKVFDSYTKALPEFSLMRKKSHYDRFFCALGRNRTYNNNSEDCCDIHFTTSAFLAYDTLKMLKIKTKKILFFFLFFLCIISLVNCERGLMVELVLAKDWVRVRFPALAQTK